MTFRPPGGAGRPRPYGRARQEVAVGSGRTAAGGSGQPEDGVTGTGDDGDRTEPGGAGELMSRGGLTVAAASAGASKSA